MFRTTKCGKCESTSFAVNTIEPRDSAYKVIAVQCGRCGTPFGVTDYFNTGTLLKKQEKAIEELGSRLRSIEHSVQQIAYHLSR